MPPPAPAGAVMPPMGGNPMAMAGGMNGAPPMQAPMMANGGAVSRNLKVKGGAGGGLGRMQNAAAQKAKGA